MMLRFLNLVLGAALLAPPAVVAAQPASGDLTKGYEAYKGS